MTYARKPVGMIIINQALEISKSTQNSVAGGYTSRMNSYMSGGEQQNKFWFILINTTGHLSYKAGQFFETGVLSVPIKLGEPNT